VCRLVRLFDHFDWVAPYYERVFGAQRADQLLAYLALEPGSSLLDIGGGTGQIAAQLAGFVNRVCVLEPSSGMLAQGRSKGICLLQGVAESLPFPFASVDRILMVDAFHHLLDQRQTVRELVRILAPGGRLVIQEPDIDRWAVKWVALAEKMLWMRSRFYTAEEIRAMFDRIAESGVGGAVQIERQGHTAWVIVDKPE
jgi:demethylmenaquinone methyltransferase/2-methoxy-6-polyprenyl-1,4-benzoquinol methylase